MANKSNHALFELIKSLNKSEKRYFKLYASRHTIGEENNYVRLFDYFDNQEAYDEQELFDHFSGEDFLNNFSITKKRLYDQVMHALNAFHLPSSSNAQFYSMLHAAEILLEKSLYDQCRKVVHSAEKMAVKLERPEFVLLTSELHRKLIETGGYSDKTMEDVSELSTKNDQNLTQLKEFDELWTAKSKLFALISKHGIIRNEVDKKRYEEFREKHLPPLHSVYENKRSRYLFNHLMSAYFYAVRDFEASMEHLNANIALCEQFQTIFGDDRNKQISVLTNAIYIAENMGEHGIALNYLNRMKELVRDIPMSEDDEVKYFASTASIELSLHIRSGEFDDGSVNVTQYAHQFVRFSDRLKSDRRMFLAFKIAIIHIGKGDYHKALKWIGKVLNDQRSDQSEDIVGFSHLLTLLLHIELNNEAVLPYSIKNVQRFFKTRGRLFEFEKAVLQFAGRWLKITDRFDRIDLWEQLYLDLERLVADNDYQKLALEYFDFKSWAEAKFKQKPFDLIVNENYQQLRRKAC